MGRLHPGMFDPFSSIPVRSSRCDPNTMDTTVDRGKSRGKVRRAEPKDEEREDIHLFHRRKGTLTLSPLSNHVRDTSRDK